MMQNCSKLIDGVLDHFSVEILDEAAARGYVLKTLHGEKAVCPDCGKAVASPKGIRSFWAMKRVCCSGCGRCFIATTGTALEGVRMDMRKLFFLMLLLGAGSDHKSISVLLGLSPSTVRRWGRNAEKLGKSEEM